MIDDDFEELELPDPPAMDMPVDGTFDQASIDALFGDSNADIPQKSGLRAVVESNLVSHARLPMLELWRPRARESARAIAQAAGRPPPTSRNSETQLLPEIFLWTPR